MTPDDKDALLKRLNDELDQALLDYFAIQRQLDKIVMDSPSGFPVPDGTQRIVNAGRASRYAFQQYERALKQLRDYLEHGNAPEQLSDKHSAETRDNP